MYKYLDLPIIHFLVQIIGLGFDDSNYLMLFYLKFMLMVISSYRIVNLVVESFFYEFLVVELYLRKILKVKILSTMILNIIVNVSDRELREDLGEISKLQMFFYFLLALPVVMMAVHIVEKVYTKTIGLRYKINLFQYTRRIILFGCFITSIILIGNINSLLNNL